MPSLHKSSFLVFVFLLVLLAVAAWFPSPGMIMVVAGLSSGLVLVQVYLILKDSSMPSAGSVWEEYEHH